MGNTGHCFNDYNHCDATTMVGDVKDNRNAGQVDGSIARGNFLGAGIAAASDPELGPGGSWCTCACAAWAGLGARDNGARVRAQLRLGGAASLRREPMQRKHAPARAHLPLPACIAG